MIKTCERCSCKFETRKPRKFCPVCYEKLSRGQILQQKKVDESIGNPTKTLGEWCREAAECNLDYGTYRTLVEFQGKTFDELKDQAPFRHATVHTRGHHGGNHDD